MNVPRLILPGLILLVGLQARGEEVFYYVQAGAGMPQNGSASAPFGRVSQALEAVAASTKVAEYKIMLRAGVHTVSEPIVIGPQHTKASVLSLTLKGEDPDNTYIRGGTRLQEPRSCSGGYCNINYPYEVRALYVNGVELPRSTWTIPENSINPTAMNYQTLPEYVILNMQTTSLAAQRGRGGVVRG
jgi:uncharacterized protein YdgA (DUF945 family)